MQDKESIQSSLYCFEG